MTGVNDRALEECRDYINLSDKANHPVVLFEMIEKLDDGSGRAIVILLDEIAQRFPGA